MMYHQTTCGCKRSSSLEEIVESLIVWAFTVTLTLMTASQSFHITLQLFVQRIWFSSVSWPTESSGGHEGWFSRDPLPVFPAVGPCEQFWHGQICPLFDVVHAAFPLPSTASSTLQGALKDGFGQAIVVCDLPEPCKIPSLDSCQKRFLWTHKEVDLARHPLVGLVLPVGETQKFPHALGFESLDPFFFFFFQSQQAGSILHSHRGGWRWQEICRAKLMKLHCQILLSLAIAAIAEAILMWTSAQQVASLHRVAPRCLKLVTTSNF